MRFHNICKKEEGNSFLSLVDYSDSLLQKNNQAQNFICYLRHISPVMWILSTILL